MPISTSTVELGTLNFRMADPAAGPRSPVQVAPRPRCQGQCGPAVKSWSLCLATVVALLAVLVWVLPSLLLQGIGMLMLYAVMPHVMKHVYPTRLGRIHVYAFRLVHRVAFNSQRPVRRGTKPHAPQPPSAAGHAGRFAQRSQKDAKSAGSDRGGRYLQRAAKLFGDDPPQVARGARRQLVLQQLE